jgi:multidrug efflux system outer membrane protein
MHKGPLTAVIIAGSLAASCTVGPEYERPDAAVPESFRYATPGALDTADIDWWTLFGDPVLGDLVDEALLNNYDVRIAASRVEEFAARVGIERSGAFPQVSYDANAGVNQISRETSPGNTGADRVSDIYTANLNVGWELDIFGRIRRATEAARADTLAEEEVRRGVILSLVTSVATSYIGLRSLDEQLEISRRTLESRRRVVDLFELQYDKGVISQLELAQVRSELERTAATIPAIERDIALLENSLSVLLGRPPGPIARGCSIDELTLPPIPTGLPSDLLQRRPDLREAELRLIAANERVGAALADFYPRVSLTGSFGVASDDLAQLFTSPATTYSLGAGLLGPLFTAGLLENQLNVAEAQERQLLDTFRLAVLTALRESEDALVTRSTLVEQVDAQSRRVESLSVYADLADKRFDSGYAAYIEVLDADRDLFDAQLQLVQFRASVYNAVIGVYKAFGGGWVETAEAITEPDAQPDAQPGGEPDTEAASGTDDHASAG